MQAFINFYYRIYFIVKIAKSEGKYKENGYIILVLSI